ncbi:hypothetical protein NDU88_003756 [Pleurodeles waltl]|uniref:Uncharacterized protein n=1 Tax=Pleurodeles waltl TaxID=8319 RepID=A0AAV7T6D3_PLEWA|nr:hypothetical protein NDU88_003756 [Pleurodeles waltl]
MSDLSKCVICSLKSRTIWNLRNPVGASSVSCSSTDLSRAEQTQPLIPRLRFEQIAALSCKATRFASYTKCEDGEALSAPAQFPLSLRVESLVLGSCLPSSGVRLHNLIYTPCLCADSFS